MIVSVFDDDHQAMRLTVSQARKIGQAIDDSCSDFTIAHEASIQKHFAAEACNDPVDVELEAEADLLARFEPGLILDFPKITIKNTPYGPLALRTCITVCALDARSKIWTRCVTAEPTDAMDQADLDAFHSIAMRLCNSINETTHQLYQETFRSHGPSGTSELKIWGQIKLMSVDCEGDTFQREMEHSFDEISWADLRPKIIEEPQIANALRFVTNLAGTPTNSKDALPLTIPFELSDEATFYPFMAHNGAQSIFVAHTQGSDAYMYGIVGGGNGARNDAPYPASVGLSAELASYLGSAY